MDQTESRPAPSPEPASDDAASPFNLQPGEDRLAFEPVPLRHRSDGLTPDKQRAYVEALADCGIAREAAARVGVSETSVNRVRRRADAVAFDRACEAAHVFGARRLRSVAYERAIEGTVRNRYYRGEVVGQDRVYDNRLLTWLLGKVERLLEPPPEARAIRDHWEDHMEALELGVEPPHLRPEAPVRPEFTGHEVWEDEDGLWWTLFPPPAGFEGEELGKHEDGDYQRTLSAREQALVDAQVDEEDSEALAEDRARRDRFFGFAGDEDPPSLEAGASEASEPSGEEDRGSGPIEYKSMHPPAPSFRRKPESMSTEARNSASRRSWIPDQVRDDGPGTSTPPYPHRRFRSIPEPAQLWGEHG